MNEPICFNNALPALFGLHNRWGVGVGNEADKLKKTFKCFAISTALEDYHINNLKRTKEWLINGETKGRVQNEFGSRCLNLKHPDSLAIGMDKMVRRSRNRDKAKKEAESILHEQPWQHDPHLPMEDTLKHLTNYLISKPLKPTCANVNDMLQYSPSWMIFDKERNVIFRYNGNVSAPQLRDVLLPYLMAVKKPVPLIEETFRQKQIDDYRAATKYGVGELKGKVVKHYNEEDNPNAEDKKM